MRNIWSSHGRALRKARKKGKLHGKSNHPHELWGDRPVPFLEKMHAQFSKKIHELKNQLHVYHGQSVTLTEEDVVGIAEAKNEIANLISDSSTVKVLIEKEIPSITKQARLFGESQVLIHNTPFFN